MRTWNPVTWSKMMSDNNFRKNTKFSWTAVANIPESIEHYCLASCNNITLTYDLTWPSIKILPWEQIKGTCFVKWQNQNSVTKETMKTSCLKQNEALRIFYTHQRIKRPEWQNVCAVIMRTWNPVTQNDELQKFQKELKHLRGW